MKEYWDNLSQSEKRTLSIAGVVLLLLLFYAVVWRPVSRSVAELSVRVQDQKELLADMQSAAAEAKVLRRSQSSQPGSARGNRSLLALVDQTARQGKLATALKRVEPRGQDEVRVRLEQAAFDDMMTWLTTLQQNYGIGVDTISIDRQDAPGRVDVTISLKEANA